MAEDEKTIDLPLTSDELSGLMLILDQWLAGAQSITKEGIIEVNDKPEDTEEFWKLHQTLIGMANEIKDEVIDLLREDYIEQDKPIYIPKPRFN